ncbi:S-type pyocin domain-containing protein [Pseudomonas sp. N3-W]|uniref:S-type pyocin domain-containing protein n=1 Tax=Pseudomonas sp. N3-W TaxID=2975049 RepID=UPI00217DDADD|nr:S-type pyocin domain-containing protein [Pseudomonas sp. N3-W]UWF49633.1 S-type pyocin domain-containing protein [Pseudomonas sp. N3-W]
MGKETPQVWHHYDTDGGGYRRLRDMTASELAARDARQKAYETMLCRQNSFEKSREVAFQEKSQTLAGCVFAKSCKLPDSIIDYSSPSGFVPTDIVGEYGELSLLGGRRVDAGDRLPLQKISGVLPVGIGSLALGGAAIASAPVSGATTVAGLATAGVAGGALVGLVALLAPSGLGDGALYTDEQLRSLKQARTRVRLRVEAQADGTLKGYGYNTQSRRDWEMIPVVTFEARGSQQVADFGDGVELIWTPAENPAETLGIPALEAAPQAPQVWIFPPTEQADKIIVSPAYPPEYQDFILVFPADSGVRPLYVVLGVPRDFGYRLAPEKLLAFPDTYPVPSKTSVKGGGKRRARWLDSKGRIYEWDYMHGTVEQYTRQGKHLGEFNAETGKRLSDADPERSTQK